MFSIVFCRGYNLNDFMTMRSGLPSLEAAKRFREVSGDLVIHEGIHPPRIVNSQDWLWDWEKRDESCYARRMIQDSETFREGPVKNIPRI